ncbi:TetR/AcrR family transcriptional regulator [Skermania sp. ID1734]|uniref:TetR/AcrR family transcriptional regulator n=1 Tax=Skermania sp. ID1734 TaxID=2597516 RepID=UPI002105CB24|nr:TetR/AcrR family transcriptional regulator [Skermania sp. ID1734]
MERTQRPYHHGDLERAAISAAVDEVAAVGIAAVSMRRIARRAGVSHAALAYQFGDKTGIFTAVATAGFRLATEMIAPHADGPDGFVRGGQAYVQFALTHPGYFEVMFRPYLYRLDNPQLIAARDAAFDLLYGSARTSLQAQHGRPVATEDLIAVVLAGWSMSHGFATLALTGNLAERLGDDPATIATRMSRAVVELGRLAAHAVDADQAQQD